MSYLIITVLAILVIYLYQRGREYATTWVPVWHTTDSYKRYSNFSDVPITELVIVTVMRNTKSLQYRIVTTGKNAVNTAAYKSAVEAMNKLTGY